MGLFSSKYVTDVSASVSRAVADDKLPNAVKTGTLKSLLRNESQSDHILEELVNGLALKAGRMYKYGETGYINGLPSGEIATSNHGEEAVQAVLDALEGTPVTLEYNHFGPPNNLHIAWMKIIALYGYDPATNQLPVLNAIEGTPVYLHDMVIRVPAESMALMQEGSLKQWGTSPKAGQSPSRPAWTPDYKWMVKHTLVESPAGAGADYAVAYWVKEQLNYYGAVVPSTPVGINVDLSGFDDTADYFHAKYTVGGLTKFFMYKVGDGTYPTLDTFHDTDPEVLGEFFPIAHFRYNKVSLAEDKESAEYLSSKKLVKYLGMDFEQVADAIDENPDIGDVEQAMLVLAVPAITANPLEQRYLYEFFRRLFLTAPETYTSNAMRILRDADAPVKTSIVIQDAKFKFTLSNSGIIRQMVVGTLGPVGSYHSANGVTGVPYVVRVPIGEGGWEDQTNYRSVHHYAFRKQLSAHAYEEIKVVDLAMNYHMDSNYHAVGDGDDRTLLVPLDSILTRAFSLPDREELYARSMHYVFTSRIITKVKWYQQFFFQALITIVGVMVAFITGGASLTAFMSSVLAGTMTYSAVAMALLASLVEYLVTSVIVQMFVKAIGGEAAMVFALVLAVAATVDVLRTGSVKGAPWASDLLTLSSSLTKGISDFLKDAFSELQQEMVTFNDYMRDVNEDMNVAQRLLAGSNRLNPLVLWGESPTEYYNRTVHSGNVGLLSIKAVSSYVTNSLKLPKLTETLGEDSYALQPG